MKQADLILCLGRDMTMSAPLDVVVIAHWAATAAALGALGHPPRDA